MIVITAKRDSNRAKSLTIKKNMPFPPPLWHLLSCFFFHVFQLFQGGNCDRTRTSLTYSSILFHRRLERGRKYTTYFSKQCKRSERALSEKDARFAHLGLAPFLPPSPFPPFASHNKETKKTQYTSHETQHGLMRTNLKLHVYLYYFILFLEVT